MGKYDCLLILIDYSEQLYRKSTQFLSKLIQNADDNDYTVPTPTLAITYTHSNSTLRMDCNEIGFSKENVEAICKTGHSTKVRTAHSTRYIGEKGIGFKSVFKAANVVFVKSGHYSFMFDKHAQLGMLAPTWAEFPDTIREGNTSVLLQLSPDYNIEELELELSALDPRLLLFLRKLTQIDVIVSNMVGDVTSIALRRRNLPASIYGMESFHLQHNAALTIFHTSKFEVQGMPTEAKRTGFTTSEIWLAFPTNLEGEPWIAPQKVYAFVPIRDYGFNVCVVPPCEMLLILS